MKTVILYPTDNEHLLIQRAAEVTGESIYDFIVRTALEEADGVAHMHAESGEGFTDETENTL